MDFKYWVCVMNFKYGVIRSVKMDLWDGFQVLGLCNEFQIRDLLDLFQIMDLLDDLNKGYNGWNLNIGSYGNEIQIRDF